MTYFTKQEPENDIEMQQNSQYSWLWLKVDNYT